MVVYNLDSVCSVLLPMEADPPLPIDADAILPQAVSLQGFQSVSWRNPKILQLSSCIQHQQLTPSNPFKVPKFFD
jgi:hypothetical protein